MYQTIARESFCIESVPQFPLASSIETDDEAMYEALLREIQQRVFALPPSNRLVWISLEPGQPHIPFKTGASSVLEEYIETRNETFSTKTEPLPYFGEDVEYDVIVRMPPINHYTVKVKIKSVQSATPKIIEPDLLID